MFGQTFFTLKTLFSASGRFDLWKGRRPAFSQTRFLFVFGCILGRKNDVIRTSFALNDIYLNRSQKTKRLAGLSSSCLLQLPHCPPRREQRPEAGPWPARPGLHARVAWGNMGLGMLTRRRRAAPCPPTNDGNKSR